MSAPRRGLVERGGNEGEETLNMTKRIPVTPCRPHDCLPVAADADAGVPSDRQSVDAPDGRRSVHDDVRGGQQVRPSAGEHIDQPLKARRARQYVEEKWEELFECSLSGDPIRGLLMEID